MNYDATLWGALACALTALGGVGSYLAWQRRGFASGLRGLAWSLLPLAAWLTGTLRLAAEVLGDVGSWAAHLVFSPVVWLGICLAGVSVVLFGVSGMVRSRRPVGAGNDSRQTTPPNRRPEVGRTGRRSKPAGQPSDAELLDGDDDIMAILKKHGIQ